MSDWQLRPGSVTDTSADPQWRPFTVEVTLADPIVDIHAIHLDGPLSWAVHLAATADGAQLSPMTRDWVPDMRLPLATWVRPGHPLHERAAAADGGVWGWCCSRARYAPDAHTAVQTRRMPSIEAMARYSTAAKFHAGLGPTKARNTASEACWPGVLTWSALGDPDATRAILTAHLTHLGRIVRHGNGAVLDITVREGGGRDAWTDRVWLGDQPVHVRTPYWHRSRLAVA